jgi:glycosyltransferase involved in cell wall biosynthesis
MDYKSVDELHNHRKTSKVFEGILKKSDIVSVESTWIKNDLNKYFRTDKIICIPNGIDFDGALSGNNRENIILTVGRLGMRQKATDILLQSFKNSEVLHKKWKLILVGDVAQEFQNYIDDFFAENPLMKDKIEFTGKISDKKVLEEYYLKSKVFAMPSRWEGFTLAMLEALSYGCYFVGTDKIAPIDDVLSDSDYGIKIESDNVDAFANGLQKVCANENLFTNEMQVKRMNHIRDNFCWEKICGLLDMEIKNKQESLKGTR